MTERIMGVLGGMGPQATIEFMKRVMNHTNAHDDIDHLRMIVDSNPKVPSRIAAIIEKKGGEPGVVLAEMAKGLEAAGAQFLVITCNTAHYYLEDIRAAASIPVLNVIQLSAAKLSQALGKKAKIGVLASPAIQQIALFEKTFHQYDLSLAYPDPKEQENLLAIIRAVKAGALSQAEQKAYEQIAKSLLDNHGVKGIIVACTELSLLPLPRRKTLIIDTLDVLVEAAISTAKNGEKFTY